MTEALKNGKLVLISSDYSISRKRINNYILCYLIATLFVLIPACLAPTSSIASIGFLLGSFMTVVVMQNIESLSFYFIILLINSSLAEIRVFGFSFTITALIYIFFWLMLAYIGLKRIFSKSRVPQKVVGVHFFFLWAVYLVINSVLCDKGIVPAIGRSSIFVMAIVLQVLVCNQPKYKVQMIVAVYAAAVIVCGLGYVELLLGKTFFYSLWKGTFYRFGILRMGSTLADANFLTLVDCSLFFIIRSKVFKNVIGENRCKFWSAAIALQILLSLSRMGILAFALMFAVEYICKEKHKYLLVIPLLVLGVIVIPTIFSKVLALDAASSATRIHVMLAGFQYWLSSPIIGHGAKAFVNASQKLIGSEMETMNVFLDQLVSYGVIGCTFYLMYLYLITKKAIRKICAATPSKTDIALFTSVLCWAVISFTLDTFSKAYIWCVPALEICLYDLEAAHKQEE